jgi:hypothetical protein
MSSSNNDTVRPSGGYSATVRIALHINGTRFPVAKTGPDRLYFRNPQTIPATAGEVVMDIDGHLRRWQVTLRPAAQPSRVIEATFKTA